MHPDTSAHAQRAGFKHPAPEELGQSIQNVLRPGTSDYDSETAACWRVSTSMERNQVRALASWECHRHPAPLTVDAPSQVLLAC